MMPNLGFSAVIFVSIAISIYGDQGLFTVGFQLRVSRVDEYRSALKARILAEAQVFWWDIFPAQDDGRTAGIVQSVTVPEHVIDVSFGKVSLSSPLCTVRTMRCVDGYTRFLCASAGGPLLSW